MKRVICIVVMILASCWFVGEGARAAEFCVNNAADLGTALTTAAGNGEADTIKVVQGTYDGSFSYGSSQGHGIALRGGYTAGCATRVFDPTSTTLDGSGTSERVLNLSDSLGGDIQVDGFTIQQGNSGGPGGGVRAYSSSSSGDSGAIILLNNIITGNTAGQYGGGVFAFSYSSTGASGAITLLNNTITENAATSNHGGGVHAESWGATGSGAITVTNNIVTGNTSGMQGGGVSAWSHSSSGTAGATTFTNNIIVGNTAGDQGAGGVYAYSDSTSGAGGTVTLVNNTITGNNAHGASGRGGGFFAWREDNTINCYNNIIWGNTATTGDDIYVGNTGGTANGYNNDYHEMSGSWDNSGGNIDVDPLVVGGGDYHLQAGSPCIDTGLNSAPGIPSEDFEGDARVIDGDNDSAATVDMGADEYNPPVYHCVNDAAEFQAALDAAEGNSADDVIQVVMGTHNGNFSYSSSQGYGITLEGGYTAGCASRVLSPSSTILDGAHTGSVLYLYNASGGDISVEGFTIQNGVVSGNGGGVVAYSTSGSATAGNVTLANNIITGNSATGSGEGGGVWVRSLSNSGTAGNLTLLNNVITGNTSAAFGGGILAYSTTTSGTAGAIMLANNIVAGNTATDHGGGGVYATSSSTSGAGGTVTLVNNTITGNNTPGASGRGGGLFTYSDGNILNCYNNIIWGNTATTTDDIHISGSGGTNYGYNNDYHEMNGSWNGGSGGNIDADPLFVGGGDYHLQAGSPCIDTGLNSAPGIPSTDFEGDVRIVNGTVDMGADEFAGPIRRNAIDFDGDGKTDIAVYRRITGVWFVIPSGGAAPYGVAWGGDPTDRPVPGDYDGDGKTDVSVYRGTAGVWYILPSGGASPYGMAWGGDPTDRPVPGDYDGDGKTDIAVYRTLTGAWYVIPSSGASPYGMGWGGDITDKPVPGDYDGDGKTDVAVYRDGVWFVHPSESGSPYALGWGVATDKPVLGDYDGDGKTDCAVYRNGIWFIYPSGGGAPYAVGWGIATDKPVPGDYDGDGKTDTAVYRPGTGAWYIIPSGGASPYGVGWGGDASDIPVTTNPG